MKIDIIWSEHLQPKDEFKPVVWDMCFRPDGSQLLVAVDTRVLIYDTQSGELMHSLKGHKDVIYTLAYSKDGQRFASGGADKNIIIWTSNYEGFLKYSHNDSIQCLAYNPVTQQLASATAADIGLWSPEQKSVQKAKVSAKVLCMAWTNDGNLLALGQINGIISLRDRAGSEKVRIERSQPIWTLQWSPQPQHSDKLDLLAVGCWDQTLSFYQTNGTQHGRDRNLDYDPTSLCYYQDGEYIMLGGSDHKVHMYTKEGVFLKTVSELDDWVWAVKSKPKSNVFVVGCNDGSIVMHQTIFSTVHGLYHDRYAHRDTMSDVIIQHLITEQKVRIKTRDFVKKIAVYKSRLAIQLPDRVLIYETAADDLNDMHYKLKDKILKKLDCNLLVVTFNHIILCQEKRLQLYSFKGKKVREWGLEAVIRYIRVVGGPPDREGLLVGLKNGSILHIFVDNRFPVMLIKHSAPIRCLDFSASRTKLAVVDEHSKVFVYNVKTLEVLFEENDANSVSWNTEMEDMLCYSGSGQLCTKTGDFPVHRQQLQGFVVGFKGSKIFCLHYLAMQTIDVPQSASLYRYLEKKDYPNAYAVACLGVTESDWRELAMAALQDLSLEIARKSFIRIRDVRYIELLNRIETARRNPNHDDVLFLADIRAFQGNFAEAALLLLKSGQKKRAVQMYLDLRDWESAKDIVEAPSGTSENGVVENGINMQDLLKQQAQWLLESSDYKGSAEMYWAAKDYSTAIQLYADHGMSDELMEKVRTLSKVHRNQLQQAAAYFRKANLISYARETYIKLDDIKALIGILVEQKEWNEAIALTKHYPEYQADLNLPYAEWLAMNDRFEEAQDAFCSAGKPEDSANLLKQLASNSVTEHRFNDASFYFWKLAQESLKDIVVSDPEMLPKEHQTRIQRFRDHLSLAELYYAYQNIFHFTEEPFTSFQPEALFQSSTYIMNSLMKVEQPQGLSKVRCLFTLAKQARALGVFKIARICFQQLMKLKIPAVWRGQVELSMLTIRTKPFVDNDDMLPVCYRCTARPPLFSNLGDQCNVCGHAFIREFCSFEILPLVEFFVAPDISEKEAMDLIQHDPALLSSTSHESLTNGADMLQLDPELHHDEQDSFQMQLVADPGIDGVYKPITIDAATLKAMPPNEVFIVSWGTSLLPTRYFRNIMKERTTIAYCEDCRHFFAEEEYEFELLKNNVCVFCRSPARSTVAAEAEHVNIDGDDEPSIIVQ